MAVLTVYGRCAKHWTHFWTFPHIGLYIFDKFLDKSKMSFCKLNDVAFCMFLLFVPVNVILSLIIWHEWHPWGYILYIFSFLSFYLVTVAENHLQRPNIGNCIHFYYILYMPTKSFDGLQNFLNFLPFFNIATNEKKVLQMSPGMF